MIRPGEIHRTANKLGVRPQQIEKDYLISWILKGVSDNSFLLENLIFKGGTCLKKLYFPDYRFSEDMDFTLQNDSIANEEIIEAFKKVFTEIYQEARIKLAITGDKYEEHPSSGRIKFYANYIGPLGGSGDEIKVDLTRNEKLEFNPVNRSVFRQYSDLEETFSIKAYSLEEVLIEKMAALMGRTIARDLYDFYYLTSIEQLDVAKSLHEFQRKAENKGHDPNQLGAMLKQKESMYKKSWMVNLKHQIYDLDSFDQVWRSVNREIRKIDSQ
ncbi:MAG: nucleotidyl transferase AbiEii/AbiGii toxin family protein [Phaeodactylibacter sp.]|nr:nucleotidyl transferase AbiEii/AbiGii toxin family protein [Phaeodactylibacter sp.]